LKVVFAILLLANVLVAGYAWHASRQVNPDAAILDRQMNAGSVRIVAPRPMVTPPVKAACLEWGTFGSSEVKIAQAALAPLRLGDRLSTRELPVLVRYWVYMPPLDTKAEVDRKIVELEKLGVREYYAVEGQGPMKYAISLGIFKTEEAAANYLEELKQKGVRSARVGSREHRVTQTAFFVREPDVELTARLAELRLQFPGSEIKAVECPS
jgi:SPOR domain